MAIRGRKRAKAGYMISAVAELYKLHPQTLRLYERVGLLKPSRSQGNTRLYTDEDLERLDVILTLARDMGVNLAGIEIILNMREKMVEMEKQMTEFATVVQQELSRVAALRSEPPPRNAIVRATPPRGAARANLREGLAALVEHPHLCTGRALLRPACNTDLASNREASLANCFAPRIFIAFTNRPQPRLPSLPLPRILSSETRRPITPRKLPTLPRHRIQTRSPPRQQR